MRLGIRWDSAEVAVISTGSIALDAALGIGGIPRGRIVEIYGPEASGKTTLGLHIIAEAQKKSGLAAFIDAEHALDAVYARNLGVRRRPCGCRSLTLVNKRWKSSRCWYAVGLWMRLWLIQWRLLSPKRNSTGTWGTPPWDCNAPHVSGFAQADSHYQ